MNTTQTRWLVRCLSLLCLVAGTQDLSAQSKVGTAAAQFLGIPVGPRAIAMGSAYVAQKSDVTALYWNPGAFQQADRSEVAFAHSDWLVDTDFRWLGFMLRVGDDNAIGISLTQLDYGEQAVTSVTQPEGTGENWTAQDLSIALSYSRRLTDFFSIGGSVKYVNQQIWNESATAWAFDLGLLFVTGWNGLRLGVTMTNFGGDLQLEGRDLTERVDIDPANAGTNKNLVGYLKTDAWPMPLTFRVGLAMDVLDTETFTATVAADAIRPNDMEETVNVGAEVGWNRMVFVRGGYKALAAGSREDKEYGLTLGAGLHYGLEGIGGIGVDYAYSQFGAFGNLNTIAVSIDF
ncbi:MAG: hypothetical protein H6Q28_981 [Bacteroidetes bacterium]|nr:hypothetical protein [Bacteroidota bacterium]